MALRLRYEIDGPQRLRQHLHVADGAGYFFFPGVSATDGTPAILEIAFVASGQSALLRGSVWARPAIGGIWLELPDAPRCLERLDTSPRAGLRVASDQLVLAEGEGHGATLCRLRDVGEGGARLAVSGADLGGLEARVRIALPEAGPSGSPLVALGTLIWIGKGETGVAWSQRDAASRAAVHRLQEIAEQDWDTARTVSHSPRCRCMRGQAQGPKVLLLG